MHNMVFAYLATKLFWWCQWRSSLMLNLRYFALVTVPKITRILVIMATNRNGQNRNGHKPKGHRPKRSQTEMATDQNDHKAEWPQTKTATNWNGHKPKRPQIKMATDRNSRKLNRPQTEWTQIISYKLYGNLKSCWFFGPILYSFLPNAFVFF